jgi:modification methylase
VTHHVFRHGDARNLTTVADESVHLVVTSPPYPMIAMWDDLFREMDPEVVEALASGNGEEAFQRMHRQLDEAWKECRRALVPGGFLCVNIGDATRTIDGSFRLYPNHARIIRSVEELGLTNLPSVVWRKATNAPTKFMGSGMLPAGAYVTLEHEHILIFRKGSKRSDLDPSLRRRSAIFWEERNAWFSDLWEVIGTRQAVSRGPGGSTRSAAFPLEIAFRLILMYSALEDTVLDPFAGTGTTMAVAAAVGRNSLGFDSDEAAVAAAGKVAPTLFGPAAAEGMTAIFDTARARALRRLSDHEAFVASRGPESFKHFNETLGLPVMTSQEQELKLYAASALRALGGGRFQAE